MFDRDECVSGHNTSCNSSEHANDSETNDQHTWVSFRYLVEIIIYIETNAFNDDDFKFFILVGAKNKTKNMKEIMPLRRHLRI